MSGGPVAGVGIHRWRRRRRDSALTLELASACDLVAVALAGGLALPTALALVVRHAADEPGEASEHDGVGGLHLVVATMGRGARLADALSAWSHRVGSPADEVAAVLLAAEQDGAAVQPALVTLAEELRRRHRRACDLRARRLPVRMLLPLVGCVLPAFVLVAVVPAVAVGLRRLAAVP